MNSARMCRYSRSLPKGQSQTATQQKWGRVCVCQGKFNHCPCVSTVMSVVSVSSSTKSNSNVLTPKTGYSIVVYGTDRTGHDEGEEETQLSMHPVHCTTSLWSSLSTRSDRKEMFQWAG
mmetsp:Transcript_43795/g.47500  ORF Transcript_43795/g.47500 Transcript_43795/m.47500 type:complete len:119 (-) Transcript_43795:105-461(-)